MFVQLRVDDRLQGAQNFPTWKERITRILDVSDVEEHIDFTKVAPTDPISWKKIDSRAMLIIMDGVKDHIVPHLSGKKTALEMWQALESLYQSKNENCRIVLYERMRSTKMTKGGVVPYLTRLTQIRDELGAVGFKTDDEELVQIALNGFSKPCDTFIKGVVAREKLPDWQRLWDDFVQEETRMGQGSDSSSSAPQIVDEEALALIGKSKGKAKRKKDGKKNLDVSTVNCFICHK